MPLKPAGVAAPQIEKYDDAMARNEPITQPTPVKSYNESKYARILYQGLTQACIQSMPLGQFAPDIEEHLKNVMATVDALAVFILERAR